MQVADTAPVFDFVISPLLAVLDLPSWEGLTWGMVDTAVPSEVHLIASYKEERNYLVTIDVVASTTADVPKRQRRIWAAFLSWSTWMRSVVGRAQKQDPILVTYPGDRYQIPQAWIDYARQNAVTWGEWKTACRMISESKIHPSDGSLMQAVRSLRRPAQPRGRKADVLEHVPETWARALDRLDRVYVAQTASAYRSLVRKVIRAGLAAPEAGGSVEGPAPVMLSIERGHEIAAQLQPANVVSAWRVFARLVAEVEADAPAPTGPAPISRAALERQGALARMHTACPLVDEWEERVEKRRRQGK